MSSKEKIKIVLPRGWVVRPSHKFPDRVYYFNVYTGCSLWEPPVKNGKSNVKDTKNSMQKEGSYEQKVNKESAETARTEPVPSTSSKCENKAFMKAVTKENCVNGRKRRHEDVSSSRETSADIQSKKSQESKFHSSVTPKVPYSENNSTNKVSTIKGSINNGKYNHQSELLQSVFPTASKAQHSRIDSDRGTNSNISENYFYSAPVSLKKEPVKVCLSSHSATQKTDANLESSATKTLSLTTFQRQNEKFDLRRVLQDRRKIKGHVEPLPSDSSDDYIKKEINYKGHTSGDAGKGVAERRMQSLRESLAKEKEANEKKACEAQDKSLTLKRDVSGTLCKNESPQQPANGKLNTGYSSSAEVSPFKNHSEKRRKRHRARRKRKSKQNGNLCLNQYKDDGLEAFFPKDDPESETKVPSKIKRVESPTSEPYTNIPVWYPKSEPDSPPSDDLETLSPTRKNSANERLIRLRQSLSNGTIQDNTDSYQNEDYPVSLSPMENPYPGAEVHTDEVKDEAEEEEEKVEYMDWEPLEDISISLQCQQNNKSNNDGAANNEWYIVVDTNIFLSSLKTVEELRDMNDKVLGYPVLIIPSVVLTELEGIKHRCPVDKSPKGASRAAIKFINYHLRKAHPRVRAQGALNTVAVPELEMETGDDKILHCCLLLLKQTDRVILLTDDINLRNRAKSFSIIACHHLDIQDAIQELYHCSSQPKLDALRTEGTSTMLQPSQPKTAGQIEAAKVDAIKCKLKSTLKDTLYKFVQVEMESVYAERWEKVLRFKPPLSLLQLLDSLRKHWVAVTMFALPGPAKALLDKLYDFFNEKYESHGLGHTLAEVKEILQISLKLCLFMPSFKSYSDLRSHSITVIKELLEEVKEYNSLGVAAKLEISSTNNNNNNNGNKEVTVQDESSSSFLTEMQEIETIRQAYNWIYQNILSFCGTMFDVLELAHDIIYNRPERLPSLTTVRETFPEVYSKLRSLLEAMRGILQASPVMLTPDHPLVQELYLSIIKFFEKEVQNPISVKGVFDFCAIDQRKLFEDVLTQLVQCETFLNIGMDHIVKLVVL